MFPYFFDIFGQLDAVIVLTAVEGCLHGRPGRLPHVITRAVSHALTPELTLLVALHLDGE
ncbi:hypothetical protein CG747_39890 [Streptomyces sp. CB02959]|nr:hypothetical protein CG747_39890 [Streptomyces sp. CB02959]